MINRGSEGRDELTRLREVRSRIEDLLPRLAQANKAFADATRPLADIADLDSQHRRALAERIRATNQEWEEVTRQINEALAQLDR